MVQVPEVKSKPGKANRDVIKTHFWKKLLSFTPLIHAELHIIEFTLKYVWEKQNTEQFCAAFVKHP